MKRLTEPVVVAPEMEELGEPVAVARGMVMELTTEYPCIDEGEVRSKSGAVPQL